MVIFDYLRAVWHNWLALISGIGGLVFTISGTFFFSDSSTLRTAFYFTAFACFVIASYRIWAVEHKKWLDLLSKDQVIISCPEVVKCTCQSPIKYRARVKIVNTSKKSNSFNVYCKAESKPHPLPLLFDKEEIKKSHQLNPDEGKLVKVAEWASGSAEIALCVPPEYDTEKGLSAREMHVIEILVSGNDMSQISKSFRLFVKDGWLMLEEIHNKSN